MRRRKMLKPIKTFYIVGSPNYNEFVEARDIARDEDCVVELRWCPHIMTGWYHEYVFEDSDPAELEAKVPKVYGL
jgi:hypothetical protein